jgi:hypothetical protein
MEEYFHYLMVIEKQKLRKRERPRIQIHPSEADLISSSRPHLLEFLSSPNSTIS